MIKNLLTIVQIIISLLLIVSIILQNRGQGLSSGFGGEGESYRSKQGMEKFLLWLTIILVILFTITLIISLKI